MSGEVTPSDKPKGKYVAFFLCWLLGAGCLFPWNSMLTIEDYYTYLFPDYHPSRVLSVVNQPFQLGTTVYLVYHEATVNTRRRNLIGYMVFFFSSVVVLFLNLVTRDKGNVKAYVGLCVASGAFGLGTALVDGGMVGDLSFMQPELVQSFLAGLAASGVLTSALRLITRAAFENSTDGLRKGALLFFTISALFEFVCLLVYAFIFPKLPIVKHYRSKAALEGSRTVTGDLAAAGIYEQLLDVDEHQREKQRLTSKELITQNIDYAVGLFLVYATSLSIFPGFLMEDTGSHSLGSWYPLILIAMFNLWDYIGRYTPLVNFLTLESRKGILVSILLRLLLVPAFYFAAKYGEEYSMMTLTSILGLTNGHFTVCVMTSAPKGYKGPEQNALGNILVMFLQGGIFVGLMLDWLWLIGKGW